MKADGGALVYIILAIISLIVSAVGRNRNKGRRPIPSSSEIPESEPQPQHTWQKELEDIFGTGRTVNPEPETQVSESDETQSGLEEMPPYVKELNKYAASATNNEIEAQSNPTTASFQNEEEHESVGISLEDFELRKAIVYAEVLNRKYF